MKEKVKTDPEVKEKFEEYDVPISKLDDVPVEFAELDVSAKTKDEKIYINKKLVEQGQDPTHYLVHEMVHFLQQYTDNVDHNKGEKEYLDRETEMEAFQSQVDYKKREESPAHAEDYVDGLLDYHDIDGEEREEKKDELMTDD